MSSLLLILVPFQLAFAGPAQALAPVTDADGWLGLCDVLAGSPTPAGGPSWAQLAYNAGARVNRWEFRWDSMEPIQGIRDFSANDAVVESDLSAGLETEGILIGTPAWAVRAGQKPGNGLPRGLRLPLTDPGNLWADYVRQTVQHYAGKVAFWEIWNEPDLPFFWASTASDYFRLLKVSYGVIKATDPHAKVLLAGMVVPDFKFLSQVLADSARDPGSVANNGYFDIAAWHAYGNAKDTYDNILRYGALLARSGHLDTPLWITEDGFPASNPNGEPRQAAYVLQTIAYAMAAGADRLLVYRTSDDPTPKTWGLMTAQGVPRMGYTTFQLAAHYLSHVLNVTYDPTPDAERFAFYTARQRVTLLWGHGVGSGQVTLSAGSQTARLLDWQGAATSLSARSGQLRVVTPGAGYNRGPDPAGTVVGGPPVMVVEDNTRPSTLQGRAYIPPVAGSQRQLILLNDAAAPASVEVAVPGYPGERMELQMGPHAVQLVDLDLLAGPGYGGLYTVASTAPVAAQAVSDRASVNGVWPARTWSVAAAPPTLTLTSIAGKPVNAQIVAFGPGGRALTRAAIRLNPLDPQQWSLPASLLGRGVSLAVTASGPILLSGPAGGLPNAVAQPRSTWYTVTPHAGRLSVFNPDPRVPAHVAVRFIGSRTVQSEELSLNGHRSYVFSLHRARAVVVSSTRGVALGYASSAGGAPPFATQPAARSALTAAGTITRVSLFNPSGQTAHVTVSLVGRSGSRVITRAVGPSGVFIVRARSTTDPPKGVVVNSDVPLVTTPGA